MPSLYAGDLVRKRANMERECQDCEDPIPRRERRKKCSACGELVCHWCYHHVHGLHVSIRDKCKADAVVTAKAEGK